MYQAADIHLKLDWLHVLAGIGAVTLVIFAAWFVYNVICMILFSRGMRG